MRVVRAAVAAVALVAFMVGAPAILLVVGRGFDPRRWSGRGPVEILLTPDDGSLLLALLTAAAWVVWALFVLCVVVELVNVLGRRTRPIRLPGLRIPQALAAGLVLAALSVLVLPDRTASVPGPEPSGAQVVVAAAAAPRPAVAADTSPQTSQAGKEVLAVHIVVPGESLWVLAADYYGDGGEWRRIARANPVLRHHGPDDLEAGWRLVIPRPGVPLVGSWVVVEEGNTLSSLAAEHLGSATQWHALYAANRRVLTDPDTLATGTVLRLPDRQTPRQTNHSEGLAAREVPGAPDSAESGQEQVARERVGRERGPQNGPERPVSNSGTGTRTASVATAEEAVDPSLLVQGVGGILAAAVVGGLAGRRLIQLQQRPVGRRISHPGPIGSATERSLGRQQQPGRADAVDRAMRLIAGHVRATDTELPLLVSATVDDERLEFVFEHVSGRLPPAPFVATGRVWTIADHAAWRDSPDRFVDEARPWPALVVLGAADDGADLLSNLEVSGLLGCAASVGSREAEPDTLRDVLTSVAWQLAFQPWSVESSVTVVSADDAAWIEEVGSPRVTHAREIGPVLTRLESRARAQRGLLEEDRWCGARRLDPELAEAWTPEIVVVLDDLEPAEHSRLVRAVTGRVSLTQAGVIAGRSGCRATIELDGTEARLHPGGQQYRPLQIDPVTTDRLRDLLVGTAGPTTPAPWWSTAEVAVVDGAASVSTLGASSSPPHTGAPRSVGPPVSVDSGPRRVRLVEVDDDTASMLGLPPARAVTASAPGPGQNDGQPPLPQTGQEVPAVSDLTDHPAPELLLMGPIDLLGARGAEPARARKQCIEYCAWLLEHPGSSATAMAAGLIVAEGTRRSNMSRLRSWLGEGEDGPYLPDAYSGQISLHDSVSSDWHRLQILVAGGVDRAGDAALRAALSLVRGAPLADAAPGQWHWAEELRTDLASILRDIGCELGARALAAGDLDLARWAISRALVAAPGDERLLCSRIRVEHAAGNRGEVDRLALRLAAQSRRLGVDLDEETVGLLQLVVEGSVRSRTVSA